MRRGILIAALGGAACAACAGPDRPSDLAGYIPRSRSFVITSVPVLVKEHQRTFPFLERDFAPGGVLEGKEVYAFEPSTITAFEGDTLRLTFVNPEDDAHNFVLDSLHVAIPGQATVHAEYVAREAGIHAFVCDIPSHMPFMAGEVVILKPSS